MLGLPARNNRVRESPRVPVETLCTELDDRQLRHALVVDLSETGLRIQRPLGGWSPREVQLELELPEIDEVVWARGVIRFDEAWQVERTEDVALSGIVRTTGIEIVTAAERHKRLLREYVIETWRTMRAGFDAWAARAACYA